ncbi:DNA-dependent RNA polymerase [Xylaria sp. CBS 124048]|nr:DNA-dependent RNA polymerase [Xylaria sp. CBS 124048]
MLLRHRPAPRSISSSCLHTLRRPHLPLRHGSVCFPQDTSLNTRRLLVTRPELTWSRKKTTAPASLYGPVGHRPLATAVNDQRQSYAQPPSSNPLYHLRSFDPTTTLHLKAPVNDLQRTRLTAQGVPGGIDEMVSVFSACLDVNKLERAALVLERFAGRGDIQDIDLITLHDLYLRARIDEALGEALDHPKPDWAESLHKWFEKQIRGMNIPHTTETIACMLKISLLSGRAKDRDRRVIRYLDMLPAASLGSLLSTGGILNQQDFGTIVSIYRPISGPTADALNVLVEESAVEEARPTEPLASGGVAEDSKTESKPVPDVLAVAQKGLGLKTLRKVLSFFNEIEGEDLTKLSMDQRREIQARLEKDCVEAAIERWREEHEALSKMGLNSAVAIRALNTQLYDWQCLLEQQLEAEFKLFDASEKRVKKSPEDLERCIYAPFMRQSTPTRLAAVTIMGVLNILAQQGADKGVPLSTLLTHLAKTVEEDIRFQERTRVAAARTASFRAARKQRAAQAKEPDGATAAAPPPTELNVIQPPSFDQTSWPILIKTKVGAQLLSALIDNAKIKVVREHPETKMIVSQMQPALARTSVHRKGKKIGVIMPNKALVDFMKQEPRGDFLARHLPMLVEPQPWSKFDKGGFLESPSSLVRIKNGEKDQKIYAEAAFQRGDLDQVSKGLDVLGRTAWQINKPVFNVMLEAWNTGEKIANIPPLNPNIPFPEEPDMAENPMARREWLRRVKLAENEKSGLHSERCFMNFQLDIARAFRDQTFYFPHNMDFRGRAYPIPAYLNHMGADHVRGILRFAVGKELGEHGLRWLKVQLANVFGYDKASLEEREAFAMDHVEDIFDSAANALTGKRWWLKAEDPWQCLAACIELKAALEAPDPTKFVSHLPIHQDGTCNGLQHYAALGGDRWGAQQVNLTPSDRPADVYSAVADLVKEQIAEDIEADNFMAKAVNGKITRKVVKQTVMTNVYGVTFVGAKAQVRKQLDALYPNIAAETGVETGLLSSYIATKIFKALGTMFRGAHDIQYWLGECAGRVCRALTPEQLDRIAAENTGDAAKTKYKRTGKKKGNPLDEIVAQFRSTIVWTTPLRMPIVQPYRKAGTRIIPTCLQDLTLHVPERNDPVHRRKQLQAFPPNFIHSLDASHMLLSALECDELGLSFAAVHDSFWTHAADIDVMNRVLRDAFIRIHKEDVIARLGSEFKARYRGSLYLAKVTRNSDVAAQILAVRYKNRIGMLEELLQERERQRLLNSSNPEEVEQGKQMVTPGSVYEQQAASVQLESDGEIDEVVLGNITASSEEENSDEASPDGATSDGVTPDTPTPDETTLDRARFGDFEPTSAEETENMKKLMDVTHFEATLKKIGAEGLRTKAKVDHIEFWLPLTFPDIPSKGDFDVTELKTSKYFFS